MLVVGPALLWWREELIWWLAHCHRGSQDTAAALLHPALSSVQSLVQGQVGRVSSLTIPSTLSHQSHVLAARETAARTGCSARCFSNGCLTQPRAEG